MSYQTEYDIFDIRFGSNAQIVAFEVDITDRLTILIWWVKIQTNEHMNNRSYEERRSKCRAR